MMTHNPAPQSKPGNLLPSKGSTGLLVMGIGVLLVIFSLVAYFRSSRSAGIQPPQLNQAMSDFELSNLENTWVNLSDYRGKVVLINTWATWCPPCRAEMPDLNAFYNQHKDQGYEVLAINAGEAPSLARDFAVDYSLDFTVLVDPDYRVMDALKINTYPTSIIVDRSGIIRDIRVGVHTPETLAKAILPLLEN